MYHYTNIRQNSLLTLNASLVESHSSIPNLTRLRPILSYPYTPTSPNGASSRSSLNNPLPFSAGIACSMVHSVHFLYARPLLSLLIPLPISLNLLIPHRPGIKLPLHRRRRARSQHLVKPLREVVHVHAAQVRFAVERGRWFGGKRAAVGHSCYEVSCYVEDLPAPIGKSFDEEDVVAP